MSLISCKSTEEKDSLFSDEKSEESVINIQTPIVEDLDQQKIEYTDDEINELINFIKNMTTLYDLQSTDWTERNDQIIKQFIIDINEPLLLIYFDQDILTCSLEIPKVSFIDLTFFLRRPSQIFDVETFHDTIIFGTIDSSIEGTILNLIQNLYSPIFFESNHWPESIKSNFCHDLHAFLQKFSDIYYKLMGLTVLYIPKESFNLPIEIITNDKELIRRIELIVVYWIEQVRLTLEEQEQVGAHDLLCLKDEYKFWMHRYENLSGLKHQLSNKTVKQICNILSALQSTYFNQLLVMSEQVEQKLEETKSNVEYLSVLCKTNDELDEIKDISQLNEKIEEILHLIRFIWLNSPFYSANEKITILFRLLSNQIILQCAKTIDLHLILEDKHSRYGIKAFEKCIKCLTDYIGLYTLASEAHTKFGIKPWILEHEPIFSHIDSFIQRCNDMIEICESMIHFGRYDETEIILKPQFSGSRYTDYDNFCNKIEEMFNESLNHIIDVNHIILDVKKSEWYDYILTFKSHMIEIESLVENLANIVFEECANVEEAIENLAQFYNYSKRKSLQPSFESKTLLVYNMFKMEISECKHDLMEDFYPGRLPHYSGRATMAKARQNRLRNLRQMFSDAHWMLPCSISKEVFTQYDKLMLSIDKRILRLYREWVTSVDIDIADRLKRSLIRKSIKRPGLMECNIDRNLLEVLSEANYWLSIGHDIPLHLKNLYKRYDAIKLAFNSVISVVLDYNKIITSLSDDERLLFKPLIVNVEKKFSPALKILNWASDVSDEYISECVTFIADLQKFLNDYKKCNMKIVEICEQICDTIMIQLDSNSVYTLEKFQREILKQIYKTMEKLIGYYDQVIEYLIFVYEFFENHMNAIADQWMKYINNFDTLIEKSLKICCQKSLLKLHNIFHGDSTVSSRPLIQTKCYFKDNQVEFVPTLNDISNVFHTILHNIIRGIEQMPRLNEEFHVSKNQLPPYSKIIADNDECKRYQQLLEDEININIKKINNFMRFWEPFHDVWEIEKDTFLIKYEQENPTAAQYDSDISRYNEIVNNVEIQESVSVVYFIQINFDQLKASIIVHCNEWQKKLLQLLLSVAKKKINELYNYIKSNIEQLKKKPQDLKEIQVAIKFYDKCMTEVPRVQRQFPFISEQIKVLNKYGIELSPEYRQLEQSLPKMWDEYMELLEYTEKMLAYAKSINSSKEKKEKSK